MPVNAVLGAFLVVPLADNQKRLESSGREVFVIFSLLRMPNSSSCSCPLLMLIDLLTSTKETEKT